MNRESRASKDQKAPWDRRANAELKGPREKWDREEPGASGAKTETRDPLVPRVRPVRPVRPALVVIEARPAERALRAPPVWPAKTVRRAKWATRGRSVTGACPDYREKPEVNRERQATRAPRVKPALKAPEAGWAPGGRRGRTASGVT